MGNRALALGSLLIRASGILGGGEAFSNGHGQGHGPLSMGMGGSLGGCRGHGEAAQVSQVPTNRRGICLLGLVILG